MLTVGLSVVVFGLVVFGISFWAAINARRLKALKETAEYVEELKAQMPVGFSEDNLKSVKEIENSPELWNDVELKNLHQMSRIRLTNRDIQKQVAATNYFLLLIKDRIKTAPTGELIDWSKTLGVSEEDLKRALLRGR